MTLGIDFGKNKIGTALLQEGTSIPYPLRLIRFKNHKELLSELKEIIEKEKVKTVVFGLPLSHEGEENDWCREIRSFSKKLFKITNTKTKFANERLTSYYADSILQGSKKKSKKELRDLISAVLILEVYMAAEKIKGNI